MKINRKIIAIVVFVILVSTLGGWYAVYHQPSSNNGDENDSDTNHTGNDQNSTENVSVDIGFEKSYLPGSGGNFFILNDSIQNHDIAVYIPDWKTVNKTFDEFMFNFTFDFKNFSYVFAYWETKNTSGYTVNVTRLHYNNGTLTTYVTEANPNPSYGHPGVFSYPVDMVKIPKDQIEKYEIKETIYAAT